MDNNITRSQNGTSLVEFGASTTLLICLILFPLINIAFIPVRYMFCHEVISDLARRLSHCETRSDAYRLMQQDQQWKAILSRCGVTVSGEQLNLIATTSDGTQSVSVGQGVQLPADWLPGGTKSPCIYSLAVSATCAISPVFSGGGGPSGLKSPINVTIAAGSQWENLARDPRSTTLAYFVNE